MQDAIVNFSRVAMLGHYLTGKPVKRQGNRILGMAPGDIYPCAPEGPDDYVYVTASSEHMWESLLRVIDRADLIGDERYSSPAARSKKRRRRARLYRRLDQDPRQIQRHETDWRSRVPCGAVLDTGDILVNEHLKERGMITTVEHPQRGAFTMPGCAIQLSDSPTQVRPAPLLGQHNAEVYGELLDLSEADLAGLKERRVV